MYDAAWARGGWADDDTIILAFKVHDLFIVPGNLGRAFSLLRSMIAHQRWRMRVVIPWQQIDDWLDGWVDDAMNVSIRGPASLFMRCADATPSPEAT